MAKSKLAGLFLIPIIFMLAQLWASHSIIWNAPLFPISDGIHYITQARTFQDTHVDESELPRFLLEYGLYPVFLSGFDFSQLLDWSTASMHPQVRAVFSVQALLLAAGTALFLSFLFRFVAGDPWKRITISVLAGCLLLGPLVIVWPNYVYNESITLLALLLFVSACLAYDAERKYSFVLLALASCLLVFIRDPMIFFVWIFAGLLGLNILLTRKASRRATTAGLAMLLLAVALGSGRAALITGKYSQTLVNIIQLRILPDPERRAFFVSHGLPLSPALMERSGAPAWLNGTLFLPDSEVPADFVAYRNWIVANGNRVYGLFLLTHPDYLLRSLAATPNLKTDYAGPDFYFSITDIFMLDTSPAYWEEFVPYPQWLRLLLLVPLGFLPLGWLLPVLYLLVVTVRYAAHIIKRQPASTMEIVGITAGASAFVAYHADAWDLWRHTVPFVLLIYFSMIVRAVDIGKDMVQLAQRRLGAGAIAGNRSAA